MDRDRIDLLLRIAQRYYDDGVAQDVIAAEEHVSRPTISRLLDEARRRGVVTITVAHPLRRQLDLEDRLRDRFGLQEVWVSESDDAENAMQATAQVAAHVLSMQLKSDSVVAISNGRTVAALVDAYAKASSGRYRDSLVIQMIGALGSRNTLVDGPDLCRALASAIGGSHRDMPTPLIVATEQLAIAMRRESSIETTLQLASHADLALVGIGATGPAGSGLIFDGWMSPELAVQLHAKGAVGHIAGHHFDIHGNHLQTELCRRTIGVPLDRLHEISQVIGIASGVEKARAIRGALTGGYLKTLVVDSTTARAVLEADS